MSGIQILSTHMTTASCYRIIKIRGFFPRFSPPPRLSRLLMVVPLTFSQLPEVYCMNPISALLLTPPTTTTKITLLWQCIYLKMGTISVFTLGLDLGQTQTRFGFCKDLSVTKYGCSQQRNFYSCWPLKSSCLYVAFALISIFQAVNCLCIVSQAVDQANFVSIKTRM